MQANSQRHHADDQLRQAVDAWWKVITTPPLPERPSHLKPFARYLRPKAGPLKKALG